MYPLGMAYEALLATGGELRCGYYSFYLAVQNRIRFFRVRVGVNVRVHDFIFVHVLPFLREHFFYFVKEVRAFVHFFCRVKHRCARRSIFRI